MRFLLEPAETLRSGGQSSVRDLDRHIAFQPLVARTIDFAPPPAPMRATISQGPRRAPLANVMRMRAIVQ